jgi:Protein of unknown function (DUF1549)/Protein of unknown function (DUF1553)
MNPTRCLIVLGLISSALAIPAGAQDQEKLPPGANVVRLETVPQTIELKNRFDYRQVLVTAVLQTGERVDVTRMAKATPSGKLVTVSARGQVRPAADGNGDIQFTLGSLSAKVPVKISGMNTKQEVSFVRDVMPIMARMGCNAGTCHGAQAGKNGFQLSLRGYDPEFDHRALIDDLEGRRFNRAAPDRSLMLLKPSGGVPHVGGVLTQPGEPYYDTIHSWIAQGVKLDATTNRAIRIEVFPQSPVLPLPGTKQQLAVIASYADGSTRDVTAEAIIDSSNAEVATVDKQGLATAVRRGETAMLARYEGSYAAVPLIVMGDRTGFAWHDTPTHNFIDTLVYEKLRELKIQPSGVCSDEEFVRRLCLDLTGLPPEPADIRAFLADNRDSRIKREALIDRLVGSPEFVEHWTNKWADLLQVNRKFLGVQGAGAFRDYIKKAVRENMPYNTFAYNILTATGSNMDNPAAAYYKILRDPAGAMENTTHLFLAIRFNCNKCHDHPFERWTQGQYYHLSSFFAQIDRKEDPKYKGQRTEGTAVAGPLPLVEIISDGKSGDVKHLRTGEVAKPLFPFVHREMPPNDVSLREQLARWITSKDNAYFAKSYVNRIWSYLLGVGLIEPIDDIRAGNPPTNPKLLDKLTEEFVQSGFDVQNLMRTICKSRTYQHAIETNAWNKDDDQNYSHAIARRLPAEVLYDAIHRVTGSQSKLPGLPPGSRAAQTLDSNVPVPGGFLELFGRPPRESSCECERSNQMLLGPVLNLINGPVLADALRDPNNRINKLLAAEQDDRKVVEDVYLAVLGRRPTDKEMSLGLDSLKGNDEDYAALVAEGKRRAEALAAHEKRLPELQARYEEEQRKTTVWTVLEPATYTAVAGAQYKKLPDNSLLVSGKRGHPETYTVTAHTNLTGITGVRLEVLADNSLPNRGPGRADDGNFVLNDFKVYAAKKEAVEKKEPAEKKQSLWEYLLTAKKQPAGKPLGLVRPRATFSQDGFPIGNAIDNNPDSGWAIAPQMGRDQSALFEIKGKTGFEGGTTLTFTLSQRFTSKQHTIGRFRLSVTTQKGPLSLQAPPPQIAKILFIPMEKRSDQEKKAVADYYRSIDQELGRLQRAVAEHVVPPNARALGAQDLAWALINNPAFLFNH